MGRPLPRRGQMAAANKPLFNPTAPHDRCSLWTPDTMRLINADTLKFEIFFPPKIPSYAILSHTWGKEEVTLQEYEAKSAKHKAGYRKITSLAKLARTLRHNYIWVDTCCIDKTDSAELTESINSMYQWYGESAVCVAYLEDVPDSKKSMFDSKWFTRGWTLQELVAPRLVYFYDSKWTCLGPRTDFISGLIARTNIPRRILTGQSPPSNYSLARRMSWAAGRETTRVEDIAYSLLGIFDVNLPLVYGEGRRSFRRLQEEIVKRTSDLTIFAWRSPPPPSHPQHDPKMPRMLSPDRSSSSGSSTPSTTLKPPSTSRPNTPVTARPVPPSTSSVTPNSTKFLAPPIAGDASQAPSGGKWRSISPSSVVSAGSNGKWHQRTEHCLFAPSPDVFKEASGLRPFADDFENFTVTNRGLLIPGSIYLRVFPQESRDGKGPTKNVYLLLVGTQSDDFVGIYLVKIGPNLFHRDWDAEMAVKKQEDVRGMRGFLVSDWYILVEKRPVNSITPIVFRQDSIHIPETGCHNHCITIKDTSPSFLWDVHDQLFMRPKAYAWTRYEMVLAVRCWATLKDTRESMADLPEALRSSTASLVVLCHYPHYQQPPKFVLYLQDQYPRETDMVMVRRGPDNSLLWADLSMHCTELSEQPDSVVVEAPSSSLGRKPAGSSWFRISLKVEKKTVDFDDCSPELYCVYFEINQTEYRPT